jgi:hypothetical protein
MSGSLGSEPTRPKPWKISGREGACPNSFTASERVGDALPVGSRLNEPMPAAGGKNEIGTTDRQAAGQGSACNAGGNRRRVTRGNDSKSRGGVFAIEIVDESPQVGWQIDPADNVFSLEHQAANETRDQFFRVANRTGHFSWGFSRSENGCVHWRGSRIFANSVARGKVEFSRIRLRGHPNSHESGYGVSGSGTLGSAAE